MRSRLGRRAVLGSTLGIALGAPASTPPWRIARTDGQSPIAAGAERALREAGRRIGIGVQFVRMPMLRSIDSANEGLADGDLTRIAGLADRYPNLLQVGVPIMWADIAVFGNDPSVERLSRAEIRHTRVGIVRGQFAIGRHTAGMAVEEVASAQALRTMLAERRFDVIVGFLEWEAADPAWRAAVHRWPYLWASEPLYVYLHRRHAAVVPRLEAALADMASTGWIERNYREALIGAGVRPLRADPTQRAPR